MNRKPGNHVFGDCMARPEVGFRTYPAEGVPGNVTSRTSQSNQDALGLDRLLVRMDCGPRSLNSPPGGSNLALVESQIWMQTR